MAEPVISAPTLLSSSVGAKGTGRNNADVESSFFVRMEFIQMRELLFDSKKFLFNWFTRVTFKSASDFIACLRFLNIF